MFIIKTVDNFPRNPYTNESRSHTRYLCRRHGVQFWGGSTTFALRFEYRSTAEEVIRGLEDVPRMGRITTNYYVEEIQPPAPQPTYLGDVVK